MTRISQVQGHMTHLAQNRGNVPALKGVLGVLLLGFFLLALMLQVQTSEAFILNGTAVKLAANWGVLHQPIDLIAGNMDINTAKAVMWGYGIELVYLVCVIGEVAVTGRWQGWFKTGAIVLVAFNFYTDVNYGTLGSGLGGQLAFAGITSFMVAFFGVLGLNMIWSCILEWGSR
jgi:hypothetical protein